MDSILTSVKKLLGLPADYEAFDPDIIMYINTVLMILLYFTDYRGAVTAAAVFAAAASGLTGLSMAFNTAFYGFGFLIGAALFYLVALFRLDAFTANLPYRVLGQQPIVAEAKAGLFTKLGRLLETKTAARAKRAPAGEEREDGR